MESTTRAIQSSASNTSSNASLPSFVELMASLGLQDEHSAHALLKGASLHQEEPLSESYEDKHKRKHHSARSTEEHDPRPTDRDSTASLELPTPTLDTPNSVSLSTPLSSASLPTPLSSPPTQRERPTSHGKKRYSPYGFSAPAPPANEYRDIYARRGSVPSTISELHDVDKRQLHHQSAPSQIGVSHQRFSHPAPTPSADRDRDGDGDERMQDIAAAQASVPIPFADKSQPLMPTATATATRQAPMPTQTSHCVGQPNLLMSRPQRNPRGVLGPRTKSQSHLRTTVSGITQTPSNPSLPPLPSSDFSSVSKSASSSQRKNSSPYSSIGRRSGRTVSIGSANAAANGSFIDIGLDNEVDVGNNAPVVSISSLLRRSQPALPSNAIEPVPESPSASTSRSHHLSLPRGAGSIPGISPPPSAPATKTTFGFGPGGVSISGSVSAARRARHARSSSARSVRDMIREREPLGPIAPLHSIHPLAEDFALPSLSSIKRPSVSRGESSDGDTANASTTSLPLDDGSRSFSQRRRTRRPNKRNSPPPPLMLLPTLPINFNIKAIVASNSANGAEAAAAAATEDRDRLGAPDGGYVSRRDPHSPDARSTWRTRRTTPPSLAPTRAMPMAMES